MSSTVRTLRCRSSAKINLTLDVLSRRADGYHELQSIAHTIGLWDWLHFDFSFDTSKNRVARSDDLSLQCNDANLQSDDNLCLKAARAWLAAARDARETSKDAALDDFVGARIMLEKNIPHGAGLGGGSGNAAATLLAFNRGFGDLLDAAQMHQLARSLGADVPFFLRGGCALMEGIGERLTPLPRVQGWLLIAQPPTPLSTPRVFAGWDKLDEPSAHGTDALKAFFEDAETDAEAEAKQSGKAVEMVSGEMLMMLAKLLHNDLSQAAQNCGAAIEEMSALLRSAGALEACMTGSGSAVFGLFKRESAARRALHQIAADSQSSCVSFQACADVHSNRRLAFLEVAPFCASGVEFINA